MTMYRRMIWTAALLAAVILMPSPAPASDRPAKAAPAAATPKDEAKDTSADANAAPAEANAATAAAADDDEDKILDPTQPDFTLVNLPTALRVPRHRSAFRVTHRFSRPLGAGDIGDLASDFFGFDTGAQIGLEYRYGLMRGTQIGVYRTSDRTIQFSLEHDVLRQQGGRPFGLTALAFAEGTNNFRDSYSPGLGLIVSRTVTDAAALYVEPIWVNNSNPLPKALVDANSTFMVGVGGRFRVRPTVYLVGEVTPRVSGYKGGRRSTDLIAFGLEKRAGGHLFQVNVADGVSTTFANIARGGDKAGDGAHNWYIGFNISRKFF